MVDSVNNRLATPFRFNREWDSPTHPERIYERSDHFVRLLEAPALRPFAEYSPQSSGVVVLRMHEFWGG